MNRVVIIGASAGGLATAEALCRTGYGGAITLVAAGATGKAAVTDTAVNGTTAA